MKQSNILVNFSTLDNFSDTLKTEAENLNGILDELLLLTEDMEKFFNTPTAKEMKEFLLEFLKQQKLKCNDLDEVGEKVKTSNRIYRSAYERAQKSVGA
jgi:hypothetical protein